MAQRLVLNASNVDGDDSQLTVEAMIRFVEECKKWGVGPRTKVSVSADIDGVMFFVPLPEGVVARKIVRKPKKQTKKQQVVKEQIDKHKSDVKAGKKVAHVPPVKGTTKRKTKKHTKKVTPIKSASGKGESA